MASIEDKIGEDIQAKVPEAFADRTLDRFLSMHLSIRLYILATSAAGVALSVVYIFTLYPILDLTYYFLLFVMYLPVVFLITPAHKRERKVGWLSYVPALLTLGVFLFLTYMSRELAFQTWIPANEWQLAVAILVFLLVMEAARRTGGLIFLIIVLIFALYPMYAEYLPGVLWGPPMSFARTTAFNVYSSDALLGVVTRVVGETLIGYLILAALLGPTGASNFFLKLAMAMMGTARGGPAKVAVLSSGFFGSLSGSIFANVVSTGAVTIPMMRRAGFPNHYAGALEACASTGGMLMPPVMGAVAFIMADFTNTEYGVIVVAAAIPSILYYFGLYCHVDAYSAKAGLAGLPRSELPTVKEAIRDGWPFLAVLIFLVWGLVFMRWERLTPFYACALLLALTFLKKSLRLRIGKIPEILFEVSKLLSQTLALLLPTSFILGGLMATGVAPNIASELVNIGGENVALVLLIGVGICLLFGMLGMIVAAYLMLALTLAPALEQIGGFNTLAIHLFIAYYSMLAAITPPVALAAFIASRISDSDPMLTSWHACRLGIVLYFIPVFFLFQPAMILQGSLLDTAIWLPINVVAIMLIAAASEGRLWRFGLLRIWARVTLFIGALLIGFPSWQSTLAGTIMAVAVVLLGNLSRRPTPATKYAAG
ncbi:MAG: TRAP transporter fused permease subunit [Bradyrhizobiaceae bacterium]|nr:TRAP transporter fused permease subunit [Bradyrhizobiaceae bacterium]